MTRRAALWLALLLSWTGPEAGAQSVAAPSAADPPLGPAPAPARPARAAPPKPRVQPSAPRESAEDVALGSHLNANTVAVISGTPGGTYFRMASDLAFVLDGVKDLRVLPVMGRARARTPTTCATCAGSTSLSSAPIPSTSCARTSGSAMPGRTSPPSPGCSTTSCTSWPRATSPTSASSPAAR